MIAQSRYTFDVFVSSSQADYDWVQRILLPRLEQANLKIFVADHDRALGQPTLHTIDRAIEQSRKILLVLTPDWLNSGWAEFQALLGQTSDPAGHQPRVLPLLLKPCELPNRLAMLDRADFTSAIIAEEEWSLLLRALGIKARVFISYKRNAAPDEPLAKQLYDTLTQANHDVFIDQRMPVGIEWAREIEQQISTSDFLVVLLSETSVQSEMVAKEVEFAAQTHRSTGKARLLPVRVHYSDMLPYSLSPYLDHIHQAIWEDDKHTEQLIQQLVDAVSYFAPLPEPPVPQASARSNGLASPRSAADLRFVESLRNPGGATRLKSKFYIQRKGDQQLYRELSKPDGTTITIRAPRQTGKSSLLIRGIAHAQAQNSTAILIDLQSIDEGYFQSLDSFLRYFATIMFSKLRLDPAEVDKSWRSALGASDKTTYLIEDFILPTFDTKLILAIDEADRLLRTPFHDSFFGLLRFWHNNRAMNEIWEKLDILMVISTEPHLLISDVTQSPFNVGLRIMLQDFDQSQVAELNQRYQLPLNEQEILDAMAFLNGHPYLTRKAMYTMVTEALTWQQIKQSAITPHGLFADHLKRYLWLLHDQPQLRTALKQIIQYERCSDEMLFYRLMQAGLVKGDDSSNCACRCQLYEEYFRNKL
jgi:hypothetical protein